MMALLKPWVKSFNLYAVVGLVILGGAIVSGIYLKGARDNERKHALKTMATNSKIVSARAYDETEMASEAAKAAKTDAEVRAALRQTCPATGETARLLALVR